MVLDLRIFFVFKLTLFFNREEEKDVYILMELCGGGSLDKWLKHDSEERKSKETQHRMMVQLATTLQFMHNTGFMHRDLKVWLISTYSGYCSN